MVNKIMNLMENDPMYNELVNEVSNATDDALVVVARSYKNRKDSRLKPNTAMYKYAEWGDYHTNNEGNGLWRGDKQLLGTAQFTVAGCKTEKAAKAKIRKLVTKGDD